MTAEIKTTSEITVRLIDRMGGDHYVVAAAKVSTTGEEALKYAEPGMAEESNGLIRYLMQHRHGTPFEKSSLLLFVHAPICVWREWHRHRIAFSYSEESARYKTLEPVFYLPDRDRAMMKVKGWKPGRPRFVRCENDLTYRVLCDNLKNSYTLAYEEYCKNLELGIDPGLARDCLPVGIYSSCWVECNPRSVMHFLSLRTHEPNAKYVSYPLWEMEVAARKVEKIFGELWPLTYKAFCDFGRVAP